MTEERSFAGRILWIMPVFVLIAGLYAGWIFYSRWNDAVQARHAAAAHEAERAREDVELNGGSQLKITMLYASPATVPKGQTTQICYGVANAKNVAFDPPIDHVWPSMNRCVDVSPKKSTTYTLVADDGAGHTDKAQVAVQVK
ncbi:MAG: hypothetical protein WA532_05200 [Candidatus Korobacteraceae bacterium]